jgi:hypothetical protein
MCIIQKWVLRKHPWDVVSKAMRTETTRGSRRTGSLADASRAPECFHLFESTNINIDK